MKREKKDEVTGNDLRMSILHIDHHICSSLTALPNLQLKEIKSSRIASVYC